MNRIEHLLVITTEECSEVIKEVSKSLRFGLDDFHEKYGNIPNRKLLETECEQLEAMIEMLRDEGVISKKNKGTIVDKKAKVEKYLIYSKQLGRYDTK
jgi:hypothetical protein